MEHFTQWMKIRIESTLYVELEVDCNKKSCSTTIHPPGESKCPVPPVFGELDEQTNAFLLALQHFVLRANLRDVVKYKLERYVHQGPCLLNVVITPKDQDVIHLDFPLTSPLRVSVYQFCLGLTAFANWVPVLIFADRAPDFPSLPASLKPYLTWMSKHREGERDAALLPDDYPGVHASPVFSDPRLFIADRESLALLGSFPTARALICDWDLTCDISDQHVRCWCIGCENEAVFYGGMCHLHSCLLAGGSAPEKMAQPIVFLSFDTGAWQAKCPASLLTEIHTLMIYRCRCGAPLIHPTGSLSSTTCSSCEEHGGDFKADMRYERKARQVFTLLTGLVPPPPGQRNECYDAMDELGPSILDGVRVDERETIRSGSQNREELLAHLGDILELLGLKRSVIQEPLPRWARYRLVYSVDGIEVSGISGSLGEWIRRALYREFLEVFGQGKAGWDGSEETSEIRKTVVLLGAAGAIASRSSALYQEHAHLSRTCASACLIIGEVTRQPVGLCFEDALLRLAQMFEVLHATKKWGQELLVKGGSISSDDRRLVYNTPPIISRFVDSGSGLAKYPVSALPAGSSLPDIKKRELAVLDAQKRNKLLALGEAPFSSSQMTESVAQIERDLDFIQCTIRRVRAARVALGLARDEECGVQFGTVPFLSVLRQILSEAGLLRASRLKGYESHAACYAYQKLLVKRGGKSGAPDQSSSEDTLQPEGPGDPVLSLHRTLYPVVSKSLAYLPQDLKDDPEKYGCEALRNPLDGSFDLVGGHWKSQDEHPPCWFLSKDLVTVTDTYRLYGDIFWRRCPANSPVSTEQRDASRLLLIEESLDPRLYTPYGPIFSRAISSFLLRVSRAFIGKKDIAVKRALSRSYEQSLCKTWKEAVMDLDKPGSHEVAAYHESCSSDDKISELALGSGGGMVRLINLSNAGSLYGARVPYVHIKWAPEVQLLWSSDHSDSESTMKEETAANRLLRVQELEDAAFVRTQMDEESLEMARYRPTHLAAIPDLCRHYFGIARQAYGAIRLYSECDMSLLSDRSLSGVIMALAERVDQNLRLDYVYSRTRVKRHGHPLMDSVVPFLHFLGLDRLSALDEEDADMIEKELQTGLNDEVHLLNYSRVVSLRRGSMELLQEAWYVLRQVWANKRRASKRQALFLLESGLYRLEHEKIVCVGSVKLTIACLRTEVLGSEYTNTGCDFGSPLDEADSVVHARYTKDGRAMIHLIQAFSTSLPALEDILSNLQYESKEISV